MKQGFTKSKIQRIMQELFLSLEHQKFCIFRMKSKIKRNWGINH